MSIDIVSAIASLEGSAAAIHSLAAALSPTDAAWKQSPEKWSILEVVNHLADEEVEDFRARLDVIMNRPDDAFAPIDPQGWVTARRYAERDLAESAERFRKERSRSVAWLKTVNDSDLDRWKRHAVAGEMSGRQMLACWMAHDLLHVRQITRLLYDRLAERIAPLSLAYAGEWR